MEPVLSLALVLEVVSMCCRQGINPCLYFIRFLSFNLRHFGKIYVVYYLPKIQRVMLPLLIK